MIVLILPVLAVSAGALVLACVLVFPKYFAPTRPASSLDKIKDPRERLQVEDERLRLQNDIRTALLQAIGGAALLVGLLFTWEQFQTNRQQLADQLELSRQAGVSERFTRAIDQLNNNSSEVRLGGIYGLEQIARDSKHHERLVVYEVLATYVRRHAHWTPRPKPAPLKPPSVLEGLQARAPEIQAIMTVLGRRNISKDDPPLDLRAADLRQAELSNAQLQRASLLFANLDQAELLDANLDDAVLVGASLRATFIGAHLNRAQLDGANLEQADLQDAELQRTNFGNANMKRALFGRANARQAGFGRFARLQGADFTGADLQGAVFLAPT